MTITMGTLPFPLAVLCYALSVWLVSSAFKNVVQSIKLIKSLRNATDKLKRARVQREMERELTKLRHEVEPKFDLWWNMTGKAIAEQNPLQYVSSPIPLGSMPDSVLDGIKSQAVEAIKSELFNFAAQLAGQQLHIAHMAKVRSALGNDAADELTESYQRRLDHNQERFTAMGVDIDEFMSTFGGTVAAE